MKNERFTLEDHLCRSCGGRVLRLLNHGPTGGGNPIFRCASCGVAASGLGPEGICWCGFGHRNNPTGAYQCRPFSVIADSPELDWASLFRACGCEPGRGEVGIVSRATLELERSKSRGGER